jgi:hypothetical protein
MRPKVKILLLAGRAGCESPAKPDDSQRQQQQNGAQKLRAAGGRGIAQR